MFNFFIAICLFAITVNSQCCCDVSTTSGGACTGFCKTSDGCFCNIGGASPGCHCGSATGPSCFASNAACIAANCPTPTWTQLSLFSDTTTCSNVVAIIASPTGTGTCTVQTCAAGSPIQDEAITCPTSAPAALPSPKASL
jgi:hypothetical protein